MAEATVDTGTETPEFQLAVVFDTVDPVTGPAFADDHPVIEDTEQFELVLQRLEAGTPILMTPSLMDDVLDPSRGAVVPMNFRTDGRWIWTDTIAYYLEQYGLAPEPELLAHLQQDDYTPWTPDQEAVERAAEFILNPPAEDEPVWLLN